MTKAARIAASVKLLLTHKDKSGVIPKLPTGRDFHRNLYPAYTYVLRYSALVCFTFTTFGENCNPTSNPLNKVTFTLKDKKADRTAIFLIFYCDDGKLKYYTGESVNPKSIDKSTQSRLNRIENKIKELHSHSKIAGTPLTKELVKNSLDNLLNKKTTSDIFIKIESVIEKMESGKILTPKKTRYTKGSIKTFRFTITLLKEFKPLMNEVNIKTYREFISWCHGKNYSTNYIGSQLKNWKSLLGHAGLSLPKDFKKITEETHNIYLDEDEIKSIYELKLTHRMDVVRDWFILDCFTGLRVSDLTVLTKRNYSKGFISIANQKTGEKVVIPEHPYVKKIIEKYKGFPPAVSDQEINRIIKQVAKKAGIDTNTLFTITRGGEREDIYFKKWERVSNHTARRSFITNLRKNGVPDSIVMRLTGIKSPQTLKRYDLLSADEAAKIAAGLDFFLGEKSV